MIEGTDPVQSTSSGPVNSAPAQPRQKPVPKKRPMKAKAPVKLDSEQLSDIVNQVLTAIRQQNSGQVTQTVTSVNSNVHNSDMDVGGPILHDPVNSDVNHTNISVVNQTTPAPRQVDQASQYDTTSSSYNSMQQTALVTLHQNIRPNVVQQNTQGGIVTAISNPLCSPLSHSTAGGSGLGSNPSSADPQLNIPAHSAMTSSPSLLPVYSIANGGQLPNVNGSVAPTMGPFSAQVIANLPAPTVTPPVSSVQQPISVLSAAASGSVAAMNAAMSVLGKSKNDESDKDTGKDKAEVTHDFPATMLNEGLSDKIRRDIWSDKFVDFVQLIKVTSPYSDTDSKNKDKDKVERIHTYMAWTKAFDIFHSVYIQKFPDQSAPLLAYASNVRELYQRFPSSFSWREYDEKFRFRRQSKTDSASVLKPWDKLDTDLWTKCTTYNVSRMLNQRPFPGNTHQSSFSGQTSTNFKQNFGSNTNGNQSQKQNSGSKNNNNRQSSFNRQNPVFQTCNAKNICYRFQKGTCTGPCKYKHVCHQCNGDHTPTNCSQSKQ